METNSKLTIIKGQEFKVVDRHFISKDDIFIEQYKQAAEMLNIIVNESKESAKNHFLNEYENNIIAFCGERGEGKSSAMLTFINALCEEAGDKEYDKVSEQYNVFGKHKNLNRNHFAEPIIVDPSQFDDVHNILDIILAKLYKNFMSKYDEDNRCADEYIINELQNQFQKVYREVSMINNKSKMLDDEFDYEGNIGKLSKLGESTGLKEDLQTLIRLYLTFITKFSNEQNTTQHLLIAIDDLDLCNSNAYKMAEQIRKYLIIPQIVIIMAVKIEQLEMCVEENTIADFKGIVGMVKQYAGEHISIDLEIRNMSERYVAKLIPKSRRIYLPKAQNIENVQIIYKTKKDIIWESDEKESLVNAILRLIRERTGMIFLPEKSGISYLLPNNLRDMINWIVFLADMPQNDGSQNRDDIYLDNIKSFIRYFNGEWITRQVPGRFGDEMRSMEKMDVFHMNLNTKWLLKKVYDNTEKTGEYTCINVRAENMYDFWKIMQWFLRMRENLYDYDAEQRVYGIKTLYTMKLNKLLREKKNINSLIGRYLWGGEFEGVLPKQDNTDISRSRFEINIIDAVNVVDNEFAMDIGAKLNTEGGRITVSNLSQERIKRKFEIYSFLLIGMFFNLSSNKKVEDKFEVVLENNPLIFENRQIRKHIDISLENFIVNLMDLNKLVDNTNIKILGVEENEILDIVNELKEGNKEIIELAQEIGTNMDIASNLIDYCKKNRDYRAKTENNRERTIKLVDKFVENICDFVQNATGKKYNYELVKTIKLGEVNIYISELYASWLEDRDKQSQLAIDIKVRKYEEKISKILNGKNIPLVKFSQYFYPNSKITAERIKEEMDKFADDICRYQGKHWEKVVGLDIEKICDLYREVLELSNEGKGTLISDEMKRNYKDYVGSFRKKLYSDELEKEENK